LVVSPLDWAGYTGFLAFVVLGIAATALILGAAACMLGNRRRSWTGLPGHLAVAAGSFVPVERDPKLGDFRAERRPGDGRVDVDDIPARAVRDGFEQVAAGPVDLSERDEGAPEVVAAPGHANVSKAAQELGVTQSAVSHALAKLRAHFDDPLFVRVPKGVAPTAAAKALRAGFEALAEDGRQLSRARENGFDISRAQGRFTLATTDYVEVLLVPSLLARLAKEAPNIQLSLRPTGGQLPKAALASGELDAACAGFYRDLPDGFFRTKLFKDDFAVGCRKGHPLGKQPLTRGRYYAADHALITLQGDFKPPTAAAKGARRERRIVYGSSSFTGMAWVLAQSDLLLVAPRRLLEVYRASFEIQVLETPVPRPPLELVMTWHALTHQDPVKRWVRTAIKDVLTAA
jgi:DNA-binding transcriptional LysR family regulator